MDKHALTALELKALRQCRALVLNATLNENGAASQGVCVRVLVDSEAEGNYEVSFLTHSFLSYYGRDLGYSAAFAYGHVNAHVSHYKEQNLPVTTIISLLKLGDEISFEWGIGGYSSPAMEGKQVTGDTLDLKVCRMIKRNGQRVPLYLTFRLETCISTDPLTRLIQARR